MSDSITVFYRKSDGNIDIVTSGNQDYAIFGNDVVKHEMYGYLTLPSIAIPKRQSFLYKVEEGVLVKRSNNEIEDIVKYGEVVTEEEKLMFLLTPSFEEVQKAKNTIEILSLLQEVM